jgi:hypothetical protein
MQHVPIKTVRAQSFVEVAAFYCLYHLFPCKGGDTNITRVMSIIVVCVNLHHLLSVDIEVDLIWLLSPVVWSFIDLGEVLGDLIIHLNFVLKRLHVSKFVLSLNLCHHRVISSDL